MCVCVFVCVCARVCVCVCVRVCVCVECVMQPVYSCGTTHAYVQNYSFEYATQLLQVSPRKSALQTLTRFRVEISAYAVKRAIYSNKRAP